MPAVEKPSDWSRNEYVLVFNGALRYCRKALGKEPPTVSGVKEV